MRREGKESQACSPIPDYASQHGVGQKEIPVFENHLGAKDSACCIIHIVSFEFSQQPLEILFIIPMCRKAQGKVKEFIQNHKRDSYLARTPKPLLIRDTSYTPSVPSWPGPLVTSSGSVVSQPGNILHLGPTRVSPERVRIFPLLLLSSCPDNAPCPEIWPPPTLLELVTLKQRL